MKMHRKRWLTSQAHIYCAKECNQTGSCLNYLNIHSTPRKHAHIEWNTRTHTQRKQTQARIHTQTHTEWITWTYSHTRYTQACMPTEWHAKTYTYRRQTQAYIHTGTHTPNETHGHTQACIHIHAHMHRNTYQPTSTRETGIHIETPTVIHIGTHKHGEKRQIEAHSQDLTIHLKFPCNREGVAMNVCICSRIHTQLAMISTSLRSCGYIAPA